MPRAATDMRRSMMPGTRCYANLGPRLQLDPFADGHQLGRVRRAMPRRGKLLGGSLGVDLSSGNGAVG